MTGAASHPVAAFAVLALTRFMVMVDLSIVVLGLPAAQQEFSVPLASMSWAVTVYAVAFGGFLLAAGKAGDVFGRKPVFLGGLVVFTLASLVGGLAPNFAVFVVARGFQGLGAALISPTAFALVLGLFDDVGSRQRAIGVWSAISGVAVPLGGLLGGLLVSTVGWRWVMEINVPLGALGLMLGFLVPNGARPGARTKFGATGAVWVTGGLMALVFVLGEAGRLGSLAALGLLVASACLGAFWLVERRSSAPLIPPSFFRDKVLVGANLAGGLSMAGFVSFLFALTFYLQRTLGMGPLVSGTLLLATAVPFIVTTQLAQAATDRWGPRNTIVLGAVLMATGYGLVSLGGTALAWTPFLLGSVLVGCYGLAMPVIFSRGVARAPGAHQGAASGLLSASQQTGAALGVALSAGLAPTPQGAFLFCVGFVGLAAVATAVFEEGGSATARPGGEQSDAHGALGDQDRSSG